MSSLITFNTYKLGKGGLLTNMSDVFNARVGDQNTPLVIQWRQGTTDTEIDLIKNKLHFFAAGQVGNYLEQTDTGYTMSDDASFIEYEDMAGDFSLAHGITSVKLPAQFFPQSGIFYGYFGLKDDQGTQYTAVNVWFRVLGGIPLMGAAIPYFSTQFDALVEKFKGDTSDALAELRQGYQDQVKKNEDMSDETRAALSKLADAAGAIQAQIDANNIITRADFKALDDRVAARLSQIKLSPAAFANLDDLKSKYPDGNDNLNVAVDTGHLWIWFNGAWKDCGQYQTAGLDNEVLGKIESLLYKLNQVTERISDQQSELDEHESGLKLDRTDIQDMRGVGSLKDIELVDENGNRLVDDSGVGISGKRWLIDTDKTLSQADLPADAKAVGEALITKPDAYGIPILYLSGDAIPSLQSKTDSLSDGISYSFPRFNISGSLKKIKVQGASSATLAKKNYTLQLDHSVEIFPEYGKQKKYVIKADMTDFSHVRNTGCAKLWGKVRETRIKADDAIKLNDTDYLVDNSGSHIVGESDPQLSIGGTYGAVDGFPIAVYINDRYWGLYSFNVPKDAWMAKMTNKWSHAIVSATWTALDKTVRLDGTDMDVEFCGTKDTTWVFRSINALIDTLKANYTSAADFDNAVSGSLDINGAIDYYVYSAAIGNTDGVLRNYLLQTWDSKKWYIAAYDLDMTFGRTPDSPDWVSPVYNGDNNRRGGTTLTNLAGGNLLFNQLWKFHKEDIIARYKELVAGPLSSGAVSTLLTNFADPIPDALLAQEDKTWPQTSLSGTNNLSQIRWWYMEHINFLTNSIANA